jgi:hypothetical protein
VATPLNDGKAAEILGALSAADAAGMLATGLVSPGAAVEFLSSLHPTAAGGLLATLAATNPQAAAVGLCRLGLVFSV